MGEREVERYRFGYYEVSIKEIGGDLFYENRASISEEISKIVDLLRENMGYLIANYIDPSRIENLFENLKAIATDFLARRFGIERKLAEISAEIFVDRYLRFGGLDCPIKDERVEEIILDPVSGIYIVHRDFGKIWMKPRHLDGESFRRILTWIDLEIGSPSLDRPIVKGGVRCGNTQLRIVLRDRPVSSDGPSLNIRKLSGKKITLLDFLEQGGISERAFSILFLAVSTFRNILILGEPMTGKTSLLSSLVQIINPDCRVILLEDVPEIPLIDGRRQLRLLPREGGYPRKVDLIHHALHSTPDYLVLGELLYPEEWRSASIAWTVLSCLATGHAENVDKFLERIKDYGISRSSLNCLDLLIFMSPVKRGPRRISRIYELVDDYPRLILSRDGLELDYQELEFLIDSSNRLEIPYDDLLDLAEFLENLAPRLIDLAKNLDFESKIKILENIQRIIGRIEPGWRLRRDVLEYSISKHKERISGEIIWRKSA